MGTMALRCCDARAVLRSRADFLVRIGGGVEEAAGMGGLVPLVTMGEFK